MTFPLQLSDLLGHGGAYVVFLLIGIAFGAVLEMSGFAYSPKLAAQFYLKDLTVLKVMFTSIVVAMVLIFGASGLGLLDYNRVWVNPTYLWPGIVGGLIMGAGFIIGGFCPGTSLVAAATFKIDGLFFVGGALFGIFTFGETVERFETFWKSSYKGRYTIPELLNIDVGVVVLGVVLAAIAVFWGGEQIERIFGGADPKKAPRWRYGAAGVGVLLALGVLIIGQPGAAERWGDIPEEKEALLTERAVYIHPGELLNLIHNDEIELVMLDLRDAADFDAFHIKDARHIESLDALAEQVPDLRHDASSALIVTMSNDETTATEAWRGLVFEEVPNVYILEGGVDAWLDVFGAADYPADAPPPEASEGLDFEAKIDVETDIEEAPASDSGGCG